MTKPLLSPRVHTRLPEGGLEAFLDRPWSPMANAVYRDKVHSADPALFPLSWAVMAPSSSAFLASLGKPLAIANDLESRPGIWWLSTPDDAHHFVIFSDSHRKNAWKGGQVCVEMKDYRELSPRSASVHAFCRGLGEVWGLPQGVSRDPLAPAGLFDYEDWFKQQAAAGPVHWPRFDETREPAPPPAKRAPR